MLKIQEFILAHDNWSELLAAAPYNLKISEDDGYVLFKYNQIASDFNEEICKEARGLILDTQDNFRVVRYAFRKFFNLDEPFAEPIDWNTAIATEKIDGSIMSVWYARGQWHISTNSIIDAFKAPISGVGHYNNFGELFTSVLNFDTIEKHLNRRYCYTFELVSPYTKVVIDYPETALYLLSIRDMASLQEKTFIPYGFCKMLNVHFPQEWHLNTEKEYRKIVKNMTRGHEGIVVRDAAGQRVKIKTLLYFEMHKAKNNGVITLERIVDLIRANDQYEFLGYFQEYKPIFNNVQQQMTLANHRVTAIKGIVERWKVEHQFISDAHEKRKRFAQYAEKEDFTPLLFAEYDGRLDALLQNITTPKYISLFHIILPKDESI